MKAFSLMVLVDCVGLSMILIVLLLLGHKFSSTSTEEVQVSFLTSDVYSSSSHSRTRVPRSVIAATSSSETKNEDCTMGACFDVARCRGPHGFKVFVYPLTPGQQLSPLYELILSLIKDSSYITTNPEEACVFVPSVDTLDRDVHSKYFVRGLPSLSSLPYWNGGRNHLIFGQYSGTWPNYSEYLDFPTGQAILARASFNASLYRQGFDVSIPLLPQQLPGDVDGTLQHRDLPSDVFPLRRKYLLAFKGKRYLYGQGSEVRSSVHHLHNGREVVMLTTCKHNRDWIKYTDRRCNLDNSLYDSYDYLDLLDNSSFCLIPRGRRLGSFRFLEALQMSCVPVSLSNGLVHSLPDEPPTNVEENSATEKKEAIELRKRQTLEEVPHELCKEEKVGGRAGKSAGAVYMYVLPFSEVLDWQRSALVVDERQLLQVPYLLRGVSPSGVLSQRLHAKFVWSTYFSSINRVIMTTLQIIQGRIDALPRFLWNDLPGHTFIHPDFSNNARHFPLEVPAPPSMSQGPPPNSPISSSSSSAVFTAIITASRPALRESAPLIKLIQTLAEGCALDSVVVLWTGQGSPKVSTHGLRVSVSVVRAESKKTEWVWPQHIRINTTAILHLHEDISISSDEVNFGFSVWQSFPSQLVGYVGHSHSWDTVRQFWAYSSQPHNYLSLLSLQPLFYHKYYGYLLARGLSVKLQQVADRSLSCLTITLNFVVAQYTSAPPIKVPFKQVPEDSSSEVVGERVTCLNMAVNALGHIPLRQSHLRLDPVLYRDNVSIFRKEYRKMEVT